MFVAVLQLAQQSSESVRSGRLHRRLHSREMINPTDAAALVVAFTRGADVLAQRAAAAVAAWPPRTSLIVGLFGVHESLQASLGTHAHLHSDAAESSYGLINAGSHSRRLSEDDKCSNHVERGP